MFTAAHSVSKLPLIALYIVKGFKFYAHLVSHYFANDNLCMICVILIDTDIIWYETVRKPSLYERRSATSLLCLMACHSLPCFVM